MKNKRIALPEGWVALPRPPRELGGPRPDLMFRTPAEKAWRKRERQIAALGEFIEELDERDEERAERARRVARLTGE